MIYEHRNAKETEQKHIRIGLNLMKARFNHAKGQAKAELERTFSLPSKSPPAVYGRKLKRKPFKPPETNWVLNSGLCPSQEQAIRREREQTRRQHEQLKQGLSFNKILRAQQKFTTLNKSLLAPDAASGGIFNLTENLTQKLSSNAGFSEPLVCQKQTEKDYDDQVRSESEEDEEEFDAFYIKRVLNVFKEKNIPLSVGYEQQKRNKRPPTLKKGNELLLNQTVDSARYELSERFGSLNHPKYYNHRRKNQSKAGTTKASPSRLRTQV